MKVQTQFYSYGDKIDDQLILSNGNRFGPVTLAYETYGKLNESKSNAILLFHALSGSQHAAGENLAVPDIDEKWTDECKKGWWDSFIGPEKILDTNHYYIICCNYLGGCYGSTGPSSIDPTSNIPYGGSFPEICFSDIVDSQVRLYDHLGINKFHAVIGSSLGGMTALNFSTRYPEKTSRVITIACGLRAPTLTKVHNLEQILAIENDVNFCNGNYYGKKSPSRGLALARMISHKTFVSLSDMKKRMNDRCEQNNTNFSWYKIKSPLESYLLYQGRKFEKRFDANTYIYLIAAWSKFDLRVDTNAPTDSDIFKKCKGQRHLIFSINSDCCFYPEEQKELFNALKLSDISCDYELVKSEKGHDSFLIEPNLYEVKIKEFLQ